MKQFFSCFLKTTTYNKVQKSVHGDLHAMNFQLTPDFDVFHLRDDGATTHQRWLFHRDSSISGLPGAQHRRIVVAVVDWGPPYCEAGDEVGASAKT